MIVSKRRLAESPSLEFQRLSRRLFSLVFAQHVTHFVIHKQLCESKIKKYFTGRYRNMINRQKLGVPSVYGNQLITYTTVLVVLLKDIGTR